MTQAKFLNQIIDFAIHEDIGDGDHTSIAIIPPETYGKAMLLIKEDGVLAGIPVALKVFEKIDPNLKISILINDGTVVKKGDIAFYVEGAALSILSAERTVLNFMQRLSGIATKAYRLSSLLKSKGKSTIILDTRKTTPGLRELEKYAVKVGGCQNH